MSDSPVPLKSLAAFLVRRRSDELRSIALSAHLKRHYPLFVDFAELLEDDPPLARLVFSQPTEFLRFFDEATVWADVQAIGNGIRKEFINVRIDVSGSPRW